MWFVGLVAPRHVGSFWTRAQTRVPCIGRQILNHCATREVPELGKKLKNSNEKPDGFIKLLTKIIIYIGLSELVNMVINFMVSI